MYMFIWQAMRTIIVDHCIDRRAKQGNPKCGTNCTKSKGGKFDNVIALEVQDCRGIIIIMYIVYCIFNDKSAPVLVLNFKVLIIILIYYLLT